MTTTAHIQNPATGLRVPAEWEPHDACWLAYPHLEAEWPGQLEAARAEVIALCRAIGETERVELLVHSDAVQAELEQQLAGTRARFHRVAYGDIWTRDTGPIFAWRDGALEAVCFGFNGWGSKYLFDGDPELSAVIARLCGAAVRRRDVIAEGGALEVDGRGVAITTRRCLLSPERNPGAGEADIERELAESLGVTRTVWLDRGLQNDHTDGHVDTLARFVADGVVACAVPAAGDPNAEVLDQVRADLSAAGLEMIDVPSAGAVIADDGSLLAASYLNFYIANRRVIVPQYGAAADDAALDAIAAAFPDRDAVPLSARAIVTGGGAFHCITRQQPRPQP